MSYMNFVLNLKFYHFLVIFLTFNCLIKAEDIKVQDIEQNGEVPVAQNVVIDTKDTEILTIEDTMAFERELTIDDFIIRESASTDENLNTEEVNAINITFYQSEPFVEERIAGGVPANIYNLKYLVSILYGTNFIGAGSLITPTQVLTTAYLIRDLTPGLLLVRGGSAYTDRGGTLQGVKKTIIPRGFDDSTYDVDIGLLKLRSALIGTYISQIGICSRPLRVGYSVKVSGWGSKSGSSGSTPASQVNTVNVPLISREECQIPYMTTLNLKITDNMVCGSTQGLKGACSDDIGGPVVFNNELCGLISFSVGCATELPNVYTLLNAPQVKQLVAKALTL